MWIFDLEVHGIWWGNKAALKLWGADSLSAIQKRDFSSDSLSVRKHVANYFDTDETIGEVWTFYPGDQPITKLLYHNACRVGPNGNRGVLVQAVAIDAADPDANPERIWMSQAMRYTQLKVSVFTMQGDLLCQNPAATTGYLQTKTPASEHSIFVQRFSNPSEGLERLAEICMQTDSRAEHRMQTTQGERVHAVDIRFSRDPVSGNDCFVVSEEDVTELRKALHKAERANQVKSDFLSIMSHELRTPLTGILGFSEILLGEDLLEHNRKRVEHIHNSGQGLLAILNDILDLSKIEAGAIRLELARTDILGFLERIVQFWRPSIESKGLDFHVDVPTESTSMVLSDQLRLRQVLSNLLSNALKFTDQGHIALRVQAESIAGDKQKLHFEISDTGKGLSPDFSNKMFEKFTQEQTSHTRQYGGTGLGLSICRQLLRLMDSDIEVSSQVGEGSKFWFDLELENVTPEQFKKPVSTAYEHIRPTDIDLDLIVRDCLGRPLNILIVDDNEANCAVLEAYLHRTEAKLTLAHDGQDAIDLVQTSSFDLILMDAQMPIMDGIEATQIIRTFAEPLCKTPIIALTANAMRGAREIYLEAGMDGYVSKPVDRKLLYVEILNLLVTT
jgi:signal transduction histidine kinase